MGAGPINKAFTAIGQLKRTMKAAARRPTFWSAILEFAGALFIYYGFRLRAVPAEIGAQGPHGWRTYQMVALEGESVWALYLGWALLVFGLVLNLWAELRKDRKAG